MRISLLLSKPILIKISDTIWPSAASYLTLSSHSKNTEWWYYEPSTASYLTLSSPPSTLSDGIMSHTQYPTWHCLSLQAHWVMVLWAIHSILPDIVSPLGALELELSRQSPDEVLHACLLQYAPDLLICPGLVRIQIDTQAAGEHNGVLCGQTRSIDM